ncbi:hypothetical protein FD754_020866, partial [Muntiacus muntjak]
QDQGKKKNPRWELRTCKLCLNIHVGESRERLPRAAKMLEQFTGQTPVSFSIRRNEKIAIHCTVHGAKAEEILEKALKILETLSFGIQEHIDLGIKYDPNSSIYGLDFYVALDRPGFNTTDKKHRTGYTGAKHRISKEEAMHWFQQKYDGIILHGK